MTPTRITRQTSVETGCIVTSGAGQVELTALAPDNEVCVVLTPERAHELARALDRHAMQWSDPGRLWIVPPKPTEEPSP